MEKLTTDPIISQRFIKMSERKVVKQANLIKAVYYLLGYEREQICMKGTQQLFWKTATHLWNADLLAKMANFEYIGPKGQDMKVYQTLDFVERNTERLTIESVNDYNQALGVILKWLRLAIDSRKRDIGRRLLIARTMREERDAKVQEEETRVATRNEELSTAKTQFETENADAINKYEDYKAAIAAGEEWELAEGEDEPELPNFDAQYFTDNWDEEHPAIVIPPEVVVDSDNDWNVSPSERDNVIDAYL